MNMAGTSHGGLLELSERMLAAARSGDWDAVEALEAERSQQISSRSVTEPAVLQSLLAHTEEVRALAGQQRDRLGEDLGLHKHRHRALSAYLHAGFD